MVGLLTLLYVFSFIDRTVIQMMVEPIERDLKISDFEMGLLMGPAFALFYVLCGLPMGWAIDRFPKRWMIAAGVSLWALATCACGAAGNFLQLFLGRMGVGVGESALGPAAHAWIAERFPRHRLSTALSVFTAGSVVGTGLAFAGGGLIVQLASGQERPVLPLFGPVSPWQLVFVIVGLITLALAPFALLLREPGGQAGHAAATNAAAADAVGFGALLKRHWLLFVGLPVGFGFVSVVGSAFNAWMPTLLLREYGWSMAQAGAAWGLLHITTGVVGQIGGGVIVDRLYARGVADAHVRYQICGQFIAIPAIVIGLNSGNPWVMLATCAVFYTLCMPYVGYAVGGVQLFAPTHLRGRVSALFIALITIVGMGLGGAGAGWLTDHLFHDKTKVHLSLTIVALVSGPICCGILWLVGRKMRRLHQTYAETASPAEVGELGPATA